MLDRVRRASRPEAFARFSSGTERKQISEPCPVNCP